MVSFDGAETHELVDCYILSRLSEKHGISIGLYRDDRLSAFNKKPQEIEQIKKDICKIFRDNDLKITVEANVSNVNFLDVTLDLKSGKHSPYTKEGNTPLYVHKQSNHLPSILRNIQISSDKDCFDKAKDPYQDALDKSGYKYNLQPVLQNINPWYFTKEQEPPKKHPVVHNPPYSQNVETKVGKCFL